jgi:peptide/nickel transport system substrate-binding protein
MTAALRRSTFGSPWRLAAGIVWLGVAAIVPASGQTVRFSPGEDAPIALNSATGTYEEGASFDPLVCAEQPCIELLHNIFEPLVTTSPEHEIEPCLAVRWERRDDTTFRFELRRGVRFHNGERFDAESVRFSLDGSKALRSSILSRSM